MQDGVGSRSGEDRPGALRQRRDVWIVAVLAAIIIAAVALPQLKSVYPFTYDELVYLRKTRAYDEWLRQGWVHARQGQPLWVFSAEAVGTAEALPDMHPGLVKAVGLLPHWALLLALGREGGARLTGALFLALAAAGLYWFLVPKTGRWVALLAALGLATLPRVFGHAHFHAMDVPIMAMSLLAAVALRRAALRDDWRAAALAGLALGCALATKLNALALLPHLGLWLLLYRPPGWRKLVPAAAIIAPVTFFLLWPWLWHDLPGKLSQYLNFHGDHFHVPVLYVGRIYGGAQVAPWHYPLVMLAVTLPLAWLVMMLAGLARAVRRRNEVEVFLALGLLTNVALLMLPGTTRYNGERLIMPAFAHAVALAAMGLAGVLRARGDAEPGRRDVGLMLAAWMLVGNIEGIVATYPYCLSYYSAVIGGLKGAERMGLEITYWGDAYAGAAEFMRRPENAQKRFYAANELATGVLDALIVAGEIPPQHRMLGRFVKETVPEEADWVLADNAPALWAPGMRELGRSEGLVLEQRGGVPLVWAYPRRPRGKLAW